MKCFLFFISLTSICFTGCNNTSRTDSSTNKAVIVKPAHSVKSDAGSLTEDGCFVYSIESAFAGGGISDPSVGSSHRCRMYREKFETGPKWNEVEALVIIEGFRYNNTEYTTADKMINRITINGLEDSLGLGYSIVIPMEQGEYNGGNELIQDVRINSYQPSTFNTDTESFNKDANINIVITSAAGDIIYIRFINGITAYDGYY